MLFGSFAGKVGLPIRGSAGVNLGKLGSVGVTKTGRSGSLGITNTGSFGKDGIVNEGESRVGMYGIVGTGSADSCNPRAFNGLTKPNPYIESFPAAPKSVNLFRRCSLLGWLRMRQQKA
jgi:hypothetical protein